MLRLDRINVRDRTHFLALSARVMRQVLIKEVRRVKAKKRRAPGVLTLWPDGETDGTLDVEDLDRALTELQQVYPQRADEWSCTCRGSESRLVVGAPLTSSGAS